MGLGSSTEWKGYEHQLFADNRPRSYLMPNTETETTSAIIRNIKAKDGLGTFLMDDEKNELDTAWKLLKKATEKYGKRPYIGWRPWIDPENDTSKRGAYRWMTYSDFSEYVYCYASGLRELDIPLQSNIGIFSINRPEWMVVHFGNVSQSYRTTALYDTLGPNAVSYIINHAQVPLIVTEKSKLKNLFTAIQNIKEKENENENKEEENNDNKKEFFLKYIIQIDYDERYNNKHENVNEEDCKKAEELGIKLMGLTELLQTGKSLKDKGKNEPTKDDTCYIMYTSGTTGNPKGVVLSHRAFSYSVAVATREFGAPGDDIFVSYLPLAHIFEACAQTWCASTGAQMAFFQGNIKKISEDWKDIRPTILIGVPRVFNKTYDKFKLKVSQMGGVKKYLVESAQASSTKAIRNNGSRSSFYDRFVWSNAATEIGFDRVRLTVSGAAPLPPHIAEFLRIILPNSSVRQGYGLTETCAATSIVQNDDYALGHVGVPMDICEVRLCNAPECGYLVSDKPCPRGEIEIKSLNLMDGYYKNEEATKKVISNDGWFSTGDIGRINPNGTLSIIDRRKNMFKTSTGEYIASEKIEAEYERSAFISQIFVYGNSFKSFIVAVIVPDCQMLVQQFIANKLWFTAEEEKEQKDEKKQIKVASQEYCDKFENVCKKNYNFVYNLIKKDMQSYQKGLKKFEWIKDIHIECKVDQLLQGFNVENNCLTPTFKKKRPQLLRKYVNEIKALYSKNGEEPNENEAWVK